MKQDIKKMIDIIGNAELSNKCHSDCFINTDFDNECTLCRQATALVKAGYRKQSETVKEFANIVISECEHLQEHCEEMSNNDAYDYVEILIAEINRHAEKYGKEE